MKKNKNNIEDGAIIGLILLIASFLLYSVITLIIKL
jgi:hypothetical protein